MLLEQVPLGRKGLHPLGLLHQLYQQVFLHGRWDEAQQGGVSDCLPVRKGGKGKRRKQMTAGREDGKWPNASKHKVPDVRRGVEVSVIKKL